MKKAEIAVRVFGAMDPLTPSAVAGGAVAMRPDALAGLSLVPWFCDLSIHWAVRLTLPGRMLAKKAIPRIADASVAATDAGSLLVGVPGAGISPATHALFPQAAAVGALAQPGLQIELATANLGSVPQ